MSDPDIAGFYEALRPVHVSRDGPYTPTDRYRDFNVVFGTPEGQRVLSQIIDVCEGGPIYEADVQSHATLAYRAGMRYVGQKIAAWKAVAPRQETTVLSTRKEK